MSTVLNQWIVVELEGVCEPRIFTSYTNGQDVMCLSSVEETKQFVKSWAAMNGYVVESASLETEYVKTVTIPLSI